jgi:NADPH:quinone reductase-like Zn-dependent oxidoreductase
MNQEMKKIVIHRPGGFEALKFEKFDVPKPGNGQILVKTKYIGVNFADCIVRMGHYSSSKKFIGWPVTPGFEFSGIIQSIGENVKNFKVGDQVFGVTLFNAYSSHIVVPQNQIYRVPEKMDLEEAGGFPVIFLTAYYALKLSVHIFPGSTILIHSAAGGVGSALLQLCKVNGWKTIGVVGSRSKINEATSMGADYVIDKSSEDLWKKVQQYAPNGLDVILDGNGSATLKDGFEHLNQTGKMIIYGFHSFFSKGKGKANPVKLIYNYFKVPKFNPVSRKNLNKTVSTFNLSYLFERNDILEETMKELLKLIENERIKMPSIKVYDFHDAAEAHRDQL